DLRLARNERVEPGRDAEEVVEGLVALPHREHAFEVDPGRALERLASNGGVSAGEVDLSPVAGREHDAAELLRQLDGVALREEEPLADLERRVPMRHANGEQTLGVMRRRSHVGPRPMLPTGCSG